MIVADVGSVGSVGEQQGCIGGHLDPNNASVTIREQAVVADRLTVTQIRVIRFARWCGNKVIRVVKASCATGWGARHCRWLGLSGTRTAGWVGTTSRPRGCRGRADRLYECLPFPADTFDNVTFKIKLDFHAI
ncbi:hypothetical protein HRbin36_01867 [bacterium HR36]|nr:hypothetical protein HRbin36_01867 [bacterium HR36]